MQAEKKPMTREMYLEKMKGFVPEKERAQSDPHRFAYHLQPPVGWLNDPNGLCRIGDTYHIYFQYSPFNAEGGNGLWGHMTTEDFSHFTEHEPAVYPDSRWDQNGAYSGGAYEEDGTYYIFYTGNVKHTDKEYDYITAGREQNVLLITTRDGYHFTEKEFLMTNSDFPADMSQHVRDPQVIRRNDRYYMFLGARTLEDKGCVLLFEGENLREWKYKTRFTTKEAFGYMWECPNYVEAGGRGFLIACPQGVPQNGLDYANVYQCGAFPLDYTFGKKDYRIGEFHELDRGFDFYAPQAFDDGRGRTLLFGWMGMPDSDYGNEITIERGWQHALTLPRELYLTDSGKLGQRPAAELESLRGEKHTEQIEGGDERTICTLPLLSEAVLHVENCGSFSIGIRDFAVLSYDGKALILDLEKCGCGRGQRGVRLDNIREIRIFSDSSSLEIFVNDGEEVFTSRIYDSMKPFGFRVSGEVRGSLEWYELSMEF